MKEKNDIDRIFQEGFKDFEQPAPTGAWDAIEARLDQEKKKPAVLPFWYAIAGVAAIALLVLSLSVWNPQTPPMSQENLVVEPHINEDSIEKGPSSISTPNDSNQSNTIGTWTYSDDSEISNEESENLQSSNATESRSKNSDLTTTGPTASGNRTSSSRKATAIANNELPKEQSNPKGNSKANTTRPEDPTVMHPLKDSKDSALSDAIASNKEVTDETIENSELSSVDSIIKDQPAAPQKRWSAATVIAPVVTGSWSGSSVNDRIDRSQQQSQTDFSYGVAVAYHLNSRWSVRTGVHQVQMNYNNQDITYGLNAANLSISNNQAIPSYDASAVNPRSSRVNSSFANSFDQEVQSAQLFNNFKGELSQQLGYLEVPLEIKYRLIDKKFGVNLMGGMSALFLTDNNVRVSDGQRTLDLGEDSNFQSFNQSANLGLGIDYQINQSFGLSLEPTFKYQLNAFKDNSTDFRPYTVGVYTGLMYRF